MKWTTSKAKPVLDGIVIEIDQTDTSLTAVTFTDASGNKVRIRYESYCMKMEVLAPPEMVKKWELSGTFKGLAVRELFDDKYSAEDRRNELDSELVIAEVEVPEE
jgi:hypothetical protein